jgi:hypothetical protein
VVDEVSIVVAESYEFSDVFGLCGVWPFGDAIKLGGVHFYLIRRDDVSEVFEALFSEFTFLWFQV